MRTRVVEGGTVITSHPDHVKSLFTADPAEAPSLTGESPLRPIVGPNSTLTALGERHMRQRKLLLPSFHGEAVARYTAMIAGAAEREIDRWPIGEPFALAPRMQAITLDVIMGGIFGIEGRPRARHARAPAAPGHPRSWCGSRRCRVAQIAELLNTGSDEAVGPTKAALGYLDRATYAVIRKRRAADDLEERTDILSLLLQVDRRRGHAAHRLRAARRAADARARRPRDDRELAGMDLRAARAHARRLRPAARGGRAGDEDARRRDRGDDPRGDAQPAGDPGDRPARHGAVAAGRVRRRRPTRRC